MADRETVHASAPGRLCLFGEHQDFLGLAVIACPMSLRISLTGRPRDDTWFHFSLPDVGECDSFDGAAQLTYGRERDYLRAAVNVLRREGLSVRRGYDIEVRSRIPINAGCSSSSALTVAWVRFLLETHGDGADSDPTEVARLAHAAEVLEFAEPGGMMDHYTAALGGLLHIDCADPITVEPLPARLHGFVLGDSGEKKDTTGILAESKRDVRAGLAALSARIPGFDLRTTPTAEAESHFASLAGDVRGKVAANFRNRDLCREARGLLAETEPDGRQLGRLLTEHHEQLRDGLGISTPKIERLIEAAQGAGALGAKINGSGGGGCMFAYAPGHEEAVAEAIERAGGSADIVRVDCGATFSRA